MFEIVLIGYLSYRNSVRAKLKEQNPILWAFITVVAYLFFMFIGVFIVIFNFCKDAINLSLFSSSDAKTREAATQQLMQVFSANPLHMVTIELFGIGGYLLVRYILEKKPGKKQPEVHWMDKIGEQ
jgi:hypothetical protein